MERQKLARDITIGALAPSVKVGKDKSTEAGAVKQHFHVDLSGFKNHLPSSPRYGPNRRSVFED